MELKTRLKVAFATIIFMPIVITAIVIFGLGYYQVTSIENTYGITDTSYVNIANPVAVYGALTEGPYDRLEQIVREDPDLLRDEEYVKVINKDLNSANSYLIVRENYVITYVGDDEGFHELQNAALPDYSEEDLAAAQGIYFGGDDQTLIKQISYQYTDGVKASVFIVTDVSRGIPEIEEYLVNVIVAMIAILIFTGIGLMLWIQKGILKPLQKLSVATHNIKHGNLDFEIEFEQSDEIGELFRDFDEMRIRLKANEEEKQAFDEESKILISNITHDLKTPITAIKGYAEGIIDGVADTQEKQEKYLKTIANKANELNILINELTLYSKVDRRRMPYDFQNLKVREYFNDCAEDLYLELEAKNIDFGYHNYVGDEVEIIGDPEQIGRVIHNIVNNSVKYMDKKQQNINLRVKDVGDYVQVEIEDNGKGIGSKDLPFIFDRFYRTDASRNSSTGGSGIGLSIVKKIMEEHGGKIWATSKDQVGTVIYFMLRKKKGKTSE